MATPNNRQSSVKLTKESQASIIAFVSGITNVVLIWVFSSNLLLVSLLVHAIGVVAALNKLYQDNDFQVAIRGGMLGLVFGLGVHVSVSGPPTWTPFGWYMCILAFFHWSEFVTTAVTNSESLTLESYLLDHSREYHLAAVASWIEYLIESNLYPNLKLYRWLSVIGLVMVIGGEAMRKGAMITAMTNFHHYVQYVKRDGHQLVTQGVYGLFRHPSYVGWFYWSIGTQVVLCNPICVIGYALASWKFFNHRIYHEEVTLINFFGEDYKRYQRRVPIGIPYIKGFHYQPPPDS